MNARDNIKPKSIRLAILMALADGEITTLDNMLLRVEEPRKKVVSNAQAAHNEGLIKRMRDDVTGLAAYQITPAGKKYLAKYADGSKPEPVAEPVVRENQTTEPETKKAEAVAAKPLDKTPQEILAEKDVELASMSRRLRDAFADVDRLNKELEDAKASLELARMARNVEPVGYVVQRPAKPLVRFTKPDNAKARALSFARAGGRAQVFALVAVGVAVPGSEWKQA